MTELAAALAAIQRPHTALGPVETTFGTYRIRCQGCDFRETTDWSHQAENAHAEHVAALLVTYLREHLTEHAEQLGMNRRTRTVDCGNGPMRPVTRQKQTRFVTDWSRDDHA